MSSPESVFATWRTMGPSLALLLPLAVGGCAGNDAKNEPADTVVRLTLITMDDVNPNVANVPSPIVLVFYELAERQAFDGAEFSQLFHDSGSVLGADVRERLEFRVEPGQIIRTKRVLDPETRYLGFVAGYRAIEQAQWRIVADVEPSATRDRTLVVGAGSLSLPEMSPSTSGESQTDEESSGWFDGIGGVLKSMADAVVPGSE